MLQICTLGVTKTLTIGLVRKLSPRWRQRHLHRRSSGGERHISKCVSVQTITSSNPDHGPCVLKARPSQQWQQPRPANGTKEQRPCPACPDPGDILIKLPEGQLMLRAHPSRR